MFAPVLDSFKNRWAWLAVNLVTAFIASRVIGVFEDSIAKLVALAALMPIVAGIGGNSGNQTITMIVRALALGQIHGSYWAQAARARRSAWRCSTARSGARCSARSRTCFYGNIALGGVMALAMIAQPAARRADGRGHPVAARALRPRPGGRLLGADHRRAPTRAASSSSWAWRRCSWFERLARGGERGVDLGRAMRRRHEPRFVRRRRKVDAALEHRVEEAVEALAVALHDLGEALSAAVSRK